MNAFWYVGNEFIMRASNVSKNVPVSVRYPDSEISKRSSLPSYLIFITLSCCSRTVKCSVSYWERTY